MLAKKERQPEIRTIEGWATPVLLEVAVQIYGGSNFASTLGSTVGSLGEGRREWEAGRGEEGGRAGRGKSRQAEGRWAIYSNVAWKVPRHPVLGTAINVMEVR